MAPLDLLADPTIKDDGSPGFHAVRRADRITLSDDYAGFESFLEGELAAGALLVRYRAFGKWDGSSDTLSAARTFAIVR